MPASVLDTPTSITAAPGLTMSAVIIRACPAAATTMSASRTAAAMSGVREWAIVTVASVPLRLRSSDSGRPTSVERPITSARFPEIGTSYFSSRRMTPSGVQPTRPGLPRTRRPIDRSVRPSTSFSGGIRSITGSGSRASGSGSWTRIPCTESSATSSATAASTSACEAVGGGSTWRDTKPASAAFLCLART